MNNHQRPIWSINLKKARKLLNLTQEQVSEKIFKDQGTYSKYEQGEIEPSIDTWHLLCDLYRIVDLLRFISDGNYFEKLAA